MPTHPVALDHMLAAWQELSPEKVRSHLDAALSPAVHFVDPDMTLCSGRPTGWRLTLAPHCPT